MSAIDDCEPQIIRAFEKEGWQVKEKPLYLRLPDRILWIDVSFESEQAGEAETIIIVEVKCFTEPKQDLNEFYRAVGQYQTYRSALQLLNKPEPLYLAIPLDAYERFKQHPELMLTLNDAGIKYVIIDLETEEIVQWTT